MLAGVPDPYYAATYQLHNIFTCNRLDVLQHCPGHSFEMTAVRSENLLHANFPFGAKLLLNKILPCRNS